MPNTSATRRRRRAAVLLAAVAALGIGVLPAAPAGAATTTSFSLLTDPINVVRGGETYHMTLQVSKLTSFVFMDIRFERTADSTNHPVQRHTWTFQLPSSAVTFASDLTPVSVQTGNEKGKFGEVDMNLVGGQASTKQDKCPNGTVIGATTTREGTLKGQFQFMSHDSFFGNLSRTTFSATARKFVRNGKTCPGEITPGSCIPGYSFFVFLGGGGEGFDISLSAFKGLNKGKATITETASMFDDPATVRHEVSYRAPRSAFVVTDDYHATVSGNAGSPFASGVLKYEPVDAPTTSGDSCRVTESFDDHQSGAFVGKFDTPGDIAVPPGSASVKKTVKTGG